jgi:hypothetical protein
VEDSHRIGWVAAVDTDRVTIQLDPGAAGFVRGGPQGLVAVGTLNSYLTIPAGAVRLVGVVTAVRAVESRLVAAPNFAAQDSISHLIEAVIIGRLDGQQYKSGVASYPPLYGPACAATPDEIKILFEPPAGESVAIGSAVVAPGVVVRAHADLLLGRHTAVLGSTGSGKSCTVSALMGGLIHLDVPHAHILVLDTNGEYAAALGPGTPVGDQANTLVLGPELGPEGGLFVPHWFMDNDDHLWLFRAGEGAQAPILQRAVADARLTKGGAQNEVSNLLLVRRVIADARGVLSSSGGKPQSNLLILLGGLGQIVANMAETLSGPVRQNWLDIAAAASELDAVGLDMNGWSITPGQRVLAQDYMVKLEGLVQVRFDALGLGSQAVASDFDAPRYYSLEELCAVYLPDRIRIESERNFRIQEYAATMVMRLNRLLADARYNFLTRVPEYEDPLPQFLRLLLGDYDRDPQDSAPPWQEAYSGRRGHAGRHQITILDLHLVAPDVLETIAAILGRLVLDFLQRITPRASMPVLLVVEEAHRYIPEHGESRSRAVFERLAKEGRKFGLGLILASQRPSELARTVLAQCGTLIAHRTVNSEDQDLIRSATPFASRELLRQLPGLATQHAVVLGEAVPVPAYVRIADISPKPSSVDPQFIKMWREQPAGDVYERVGRPWQAGDFVGAGTVGTVKPPSAPSLKDESASDEEMSDGIVDEEWPDESPWTRDDEADDWSSQ